MKSNSIYNSILSGLVVLLGVETRADAPRGNDIQPLAANCNIGPFDQTSKAGDYNLICSEMTDSEKCLALVKASMRINFDLAVSHQQGKAAYCLALFKSKLLEPTE